VIAALLRFPAHLARGVSAGPFGLRRGAVLLVTIPALVSVWVVHLLALLLDEIWYPGYRDITVREPLFVVGLPRSGTSRMQEILADDPRFTSLRLWQLVLAPAICERRVVVRAGRLDSALGGWGRRGLEATQRAVFAFMEEVHPVRLDQPEEDYLLLWPVFACFLLIVPFPRSERVWALTRVDDWRPERRRRITRVYRRMVQRHLHESPDGIRLLSKNPSFTPLVASLLEEFPDGRVIGCLRDPRRVVPSLLSSLEDGARVFGWSPADPAYRDRFLGMLEEFSDRLLSFEGRYGEDVYQSLLLRDVRSDLVASVGTVYERFGWALGPHLVGALEARASAVRTHASSHSYDLADYGLDTACVETRFARLMTRFDIGGASSHGDSPA